ncbi:MAG: hypothetical protein Q8O37_13250 [Sulfuricellaceae bacterium]|nr:hypothetical protein [Sulfuricellaceae bacterium]
MRTCSGERLLSHHTLPCLSRTILRLSRFNAQQPGAFLSLSRRPLRTIRLATERPGTLLSLIGIPPRLLQLQLLKA